MASFSNFGEQFAAKTLRKFYQSAITPMITNSNYEGEIKKAGDRVNILSFLEDVSLGDYVVGTDMSNQNIVDREDTLVVEKRKYYSFPIDKLEDLFTYVDDADSTLVDNANKVLERSVDSYVLENARFSRAGNWVGINLRVAGGGSTDGTQASIATTTTGGTLTIQGDDEGGNDTNGTLTHSVENTEDGRFYFSGFTAADVDKPIRLTSGKTWATGWYRITAVTDSFTCSIENWDGATAGADIPNGDILRYMYGGSGDDEATYNQNGDGKPTAVVTGAGANSGWGYEFQAAAGTAITASNVYDAITMLATALDKGEIPDTDRHITCPPIMVEMLRQAAELQPAISMAYEGVVLNGKVGRVAGFDIHMAAGSRVSSRVSHAIPQTNVSAATWNGASFVFGSAPQTYMVLANHISFCTFAYKWAESRIVDAEDQFAKKYQGLHLWGALVPNLRRKAGATLFCTF